MRLVVAELVAVAARFEGVLVGWREELHPLKLLSLLQLIAAPDFLKVSCTITLNSQIIAITLATRSHLIILL